MTAETEETERTEETEETEGTKRTEETEGTKESGAGEVEGGEVRGEKGWELRMRVGLRMRML